MNQSTGKNLREGYSTGAYATALCVAAYQNHLVPHPDLSPDLLPGLQQTNALDIRFPDGVLRTLQVHIAPDGTARTIKDGGDDPDCTHGASCYARLRPATLSEARAEDYLLSVGAGIVILRAIEGIGLCTRPGLDCEPGKWAINTTPRRMITENLARVGLASGVWLAELGIVNGEAIAQNTLNGHLGIQGGLSILGTSGLVRPFSHDAYCETVRLCVKSEHLLGGDTVIFCTGGRTRSGARRLYPKLPETAFISIGDFIAESLRAAHEFTIPQVMIACMPGKLCKYAAGFDNTHAHRVRQDMNLLRREAKRLFPEYPELPPRLAECVSVREALLVIPEQGHSLLFRRLADLALQQFASRFACKDLPALRLLLFDFEGNPIMDVSQTTTPCGSLAIYSCGTGFLHTDTIQNILHDADIVFGSKKLLHNCASALNETDRHKPDYHVISAQARQDAESALTLYRAGKRVVVLCSGDALYHGFGGTLAACARAASIDPETAFRFHPGITAFQSLFHRLGISWQGAKLFSAHDETPDLRGMVESPLAVVYGGNRYPAHALAAGILAVHPEASARPGVIAENLSQPGTTFPTACGTAPNSFEERIIHGTLAELAQITTGPTSILLLLPAPELSGPVLPLGLPEDFFERESNLITASDVRAIILSRLRLPAWGVLWDIGAGSGSVGLEAAALRPQLTVVAFEKHPGRVAMIRRNATRLGIANHHTCLLDATALPFSTASSLLRRDIESTTTLDSPLESLGKGGGSGEGEPFFRRVSLPRYHLFPPNRIFIGGGGKHILDILDRAFAVLEPEGLIVASAVTIETIHNLQEWHPERRIDMRTIDIAHEETIAGSWHHWQAQNRITLFTFQKRAL